MTLAPTPPNTTDAAGIPGIALVGKIRRVLIVSLIAALAYASLMVSSLSYCPGGFDGNGGYIDAEGRPVDYAPQCVDLALKPSPLVFVAIALIVFLAIGRVMKASDEATAQRTLDRAAIAVALLVVLAVVVSWVWFRMVPVEEFTAGTASILSPFPFGLIDVETTPLLEP